MRFNGVDIREVHRGVSVEKEIPPGMPTRTVETFSGWDGETLAGVTMSRSTYTVRANIACRRPEDGWQVRALLAAWAMSSGNGTAELEPSYWPGMAYDAVAEKISAPEFFKGFARVEISFALPRPVAHETIISIASGNGTASMLVGGSLPCRPILRQTIADSASGIVWSLDGVAFFTVNGAFGAGQVVEADLAKAFLTVDGAHTESRINLTATNWRPGFAPGPHTLTSSNAGTLEARWQNEWA